MADKYVPQVDYTSRDYTSIRDDMTALIPDYAPTWTTRDPADIGMTLLQLFSYMGDLLNHYIDRSANEAFISTASQRDSVLQLARLLGYSPKENVAATVTLTFYNSTASPITVPAKTQVATTVVSNNVTTQIIFETSAVATVPAKVGAVNGNVQVTATHGVTFTEIIGTSTGLSNQVFKLSKTPVVNNSVSITVGATAYTQVPYLIDYSGYDAVFSTYTNAAGITYAIFGDGISGSIPANTAVITATYSIGGGVVGNVSANTIKTILTNATAGLTVLNTTYGSSTDDGSAKGGTDVESTDSIRLNSPLSFRALNRAVSLSDYAALAVAGGAAKASAVAEVYSSVTIFFVPYGDSGVLTDGVTPSTVFTNTIPTLNAYLTNKVPANTTITYQPASYANVQLFANITVQPKYNQTLTKLNVGLAVVNLFALDNVAFHDTIYLSDVFGAITSVPGVGSVQIVKLIRGDQAQSFNISNKALTSNVATITTSATHNITVGQSIYVSGVGTGNGDFDGTYTVTAVGSTTISYVNVYTNVVSVAVSPVGKVSVLAVKDIKCDSNEIPQLDGTNLTLTYTGGL
jgi:hypothetical protein